jgi:hypothetical protein
LTSYQKRVRELKKKLTTIGSNSKDINFNTVQKTTTSNPTSSTITKNSMPTKKTSSVNSESPKSTLPIISQTQCPQNKSQNELIDFNDSTDSESEDQTLEVSYKYIHIF